jgi:hypothetical protein
LSDRDKKRELWRLAAEAAIAAEDKAARYKEGKPIFLDMIIETLIEQAEENGQKLATTKAERMARTSKRYRSYLKKMHNARLSAEQLRLQAQDMDRRYWEGVSSEATYRAEMRMTQ